MTTNSAITSELLDQLLANSPAKPPAMPERIEAVLQLRELGRSITTISSGEPRGPQGDRNVTGS